MRYLSIFITLFFLSTFLYAQKEVKPTIFSSVAPGQTKTLTLDISSYNANTIGELKDDLITFYGKVILVEVNEKSKKLTLEYNEFMLEQDLITIFRKYDVNYYIKDQSPNSSINSSN